MSPSPPWKKELIALCHAVVEDRLTEAERARLEELVLSDPEACQAYVENLHQHACLTWSAGHLDTSAEPVREASCELAADPARSEGVSLAADRRMPRWLATLLSSAAALLVGLWSGWAMTGSVNTWSVATLTRCKACTWSGGTLPIESGARLVRGTMRLASGIAQVRFDSGALATVEGPAVLEIVSSRRCVVHAGRVMAEVATRTTFFVESRRVSVRGSDTTFGVNVESADVTEVQAFRLPVTALLASGRTLEVEPGTVLRINKGHLVQFSADDDGLPAWEPIPLPRGATMVQISTANGCGRDAYIESRDVAAPRNPALLLVKSILPLDQKCQRKVYLGFDLSTVAGREILDARLELTMCPVRNTFASMFPDATFAVYGLTDNTLDGWDDRSLTWQNAPANAPGGTALDQRKVTLLGRFLVEQGVQQGTFSINGAALADFLRRDHNGPATLIVVRETTDTYQKSLIHGFASRFHPQLPPPTLKLTLGRQASASSSHADVPEKTP
jgi:hypothetical protein